MQQVSGSNSCIVICSGTWTMLKTSQAARLTQQPRLLAWVPSSPPKVACKLAFRSYSSLRCLLSGVVLAKALIESAEPQMVLPCDIVLSLMHACTQAHRVSSGLLQPTSENSTWQATYCPAGQRLPALASLDLSLNPMAWPSNSPGAVAVTPFRRLKTLVLNQCCFSWPQVMAASI